MKIICKWLIRDTNVGGSGFRMHLGEKNNGKHEKGLQVVFDEFEKLILEAFSTQGRNLLTVLT